MSKKSIRFFNDREVRAVWDEEHSKWWFSAVDVVRAINDEDDYKKVRNYWKYLKGKMAKDGIELVSVTNHFKFQAPDGKQRAADAFDAECVQTLAKNYPNNRARAFLEWFTYSDNTIDGQSKKKAYTLVESGLLDTMKPGTVECLQQIHAYLFGGLYDFAGQIRTKTIWKPAIKREQICSNNLPSVSGFDKVKDGTLFCRAEYLMQNLRHIEAMPESTFDEIVNKYVEMNVAHPFMEGNGRSTRIWLDLMFKKRLKLCVDWSLIDKKSYLAAMRSSTTDASAIRALLGQAMTDRIDDREIFMKGIDYSYYYEQTD